MSALFVLLVLGVVAYLAREVDWPAVVTSIQAYSARTLLVAAALAAASYATYCTYDLIGRQQTGHKLRTLQVVGVGFISYAFNLNIGSLVGGVAFRYKLYSRLGLQTEVITRVLALSLATNWLGYCFLAGAVFLFQPLALPTDWKLGSGGLQVLGAALLLVVVGYLCLCFVARQRVWHVRGQAFDLPSGRMALMQLLVSSINWLLIGGVVYTLLQYSIDYSTVLSALLLASVAGLIVHVPGGLGVLEAVFVALLAGRLAQGELLAGLLAYRAIYYLAPLVLAGVLYFVVDARARRADSAVLAGSRPGA
ncbi:MAG: lysylphosphatidylglycerol synthase domain-containing protein [Burkholderiaceae bacterium]